MNREDRLRTARQEIDLGIDEAITVLRGSVEFRDAVEALLVGTPYARPADAAQDFEGLYGRVRSALRPMKFERDVLNLLDELNDFLDNYVDVVDGAEGKPRPNRAMSLTSEIDRVSAALRRTFTEAK